MTTAATLITVNTGQSANDGTGSTIKDAFDLINDNIDKLNFQLNSDGIHSAQYPATYLTLTKDLYANAGIIQGATIKASSIFVNGSPVLTSQSGGWAGGTIPYYGIFANTDPSTSTTTGVLQVAGGAGIQGNLFLGGLFDVAGNATMGNVLATGKLTINNISTTGTGSFNQLTVAAGSTLSGSTLFTGQSTFNGIPTFNAASAFNNDANFFANINLQGYLTGTGAININQGVFNGLYVTNINSSSINSNFIGANTAVINNLSTNGIVLLSNTKPSMGTTDGALVVSGGVGIGGDLNVAGNTIINGNLTVTGTTVSINTEIINQSVVVASSVTAPSFSGNIIRVAFVGNIGSFHIGNGGGLSNLNGANIQLGTVQNGSLSNSTITVNAGTGISGGGTVALGGNITITNSGVTGLTAGSGISLSGSTGNVTVSTATTAAFANIAHVGTSGVGDIGSASNTFGTVYATATSAKYADVAENYIADQDYSPGTVLAFGGVNEVTLAEDGTRRVAGVVSSEPAYLMNSHCTGDYVAAIALQGRVPCKVRGKIEKGDMLVSAGSGFARADYNPILGSVIGKALENFDGIEGVIEVVVGRL